MDNTLKLIGEGISAEVYTNGVYAYKKYKKGYSLENMRFEVAVQNEISTHTNLPVAEYHVIDGMIQMTLFEGKNLAERINQDQYTAGFQEFIDLQCEIFQYESLRLANSYETFSEQIINSPLDENLKAKALKSIDLIDKTYHLCHFDYHPENIMYHDNQPYIIDWTNAKLGNPVMDIASTYIIFQLFAAEFANPYLEEMIKKGYSYHEIMDAIPVMAFIRLRETKEEGLVQKLRKLILDV